MGIWLSARFTHAACEKAGKWKNKVERKINKIRCRKHSLPIAFLSCVRRGTKLAARLSTLVTSVSSTGRSESRRSSSRPCWAALTLVHVLDHFSRLLIVPLSGLLQCQAPRHRRQPRSPLFTKLFRRLLKFQSFSSHACSTARTHLERLKTARRKENSEAANLADFTLCCCNA